MRFVLSVLVVTSVAVGQVPPYMPLGSVDPNVPPPSAILGYEIGTRFTDFRNLERYLDRLVGSSNRVRRVVYGETYEHRPLQVLVISSSKNLDRLEELRLHNLRLTDPRTTSAAEADRIMATLPAIVWLSYGVHGNESSSPEAAMVTAYQLLAGTDARTESILDNLVIIIDPAVNPDGRERYVRWVNGVSSNPPNTNPDAVEHHEPWPGGRTNHYLFDLNRDWAWQTQAETRARIRLYRTWMPHTHVDYHEMGYTSSYFFFPAAVPIHDALPAQVKTWGELYGRGNAEAFDRVGIPYYVAESFDLYYPGYGDSWPTFNGAIGMTYEQAGHARAGLAIERPDKKILTLAERTRNHFLTGIATLETTVKHKKERLKDFTAYWTEALRVPGPVTGVAFRGDEDPPRAAQLAGLLMDQGIEVRRLERPTTILGAAFFDPRSTRRMLPAGTYIVSFQQPQRRLATALLEPRPVVRDTFFYDVSAWSLPVAYGITAYTLEGSAPASELLSTAPRIEGRVEGGPASYAYAIPWTRHAAARMVWNLHAKGYRLTAATKPFTQNGRYFGAGTVILFTAENGDSLHADLRTYAKDYGVDVFATSTGLTEQGISLGSDRVRPLVRPTIAVVTDAPVSPYDFGEVWHLFERTYGIPFTAIPSRNLLSSDLEQYDVILLPDAGNLAAVFDSSGVDALRRWVRAGGVLIGLEGSARYLVKSRSGLTPAVLQGDNKEEEKTKEEKEAEKVKKEEAKRRTLWEKEEYDRVANIPGSIFRILVDTTHPIGFGMPGTMPVLKGNAPPLELTESGHTVARFSKDTVALSGYAFAERAKKLAETAYIQEFRLGKGRAVLFLEPVTFRLFWEGTTKFLLNAVIFLPQP